MNETESRNCQAFVDLLRKKKGQVWESVKGFLAWLKNRSPAKPARETEPEVGQEPDATAYLDINTARDLENLRASLKNTAKLRRAIGALNERAQSKLNKLCDKAESIEFLSPEEEEITEDAAEKLRKIATELLQFHYMVRGGSYAQNLENELDNFFQGLGIEKLIVPLENGADKWIDLNLPSKTVITKPASSAADLPHLASVYQQPRILRYIDRFGRKEEICFGGLCVMYSMEN